ncbi:type II toxin-antitoxin system HicA family toxin [Geomonas edaphica]|uniref:type II toxin-antitoxin system HicA family toxin n=1 Tax=Geomonas edaphica TaxID=2570226 RepID=UPI0010A783AC|nr:type II toxin-antitoxin system HicA family toxin [Geomonas edaphica]
MKLPRDITGYDLAKALRKFDYTITRQTGSHIRLSTTADGEHHITVPAHIPLKVGTLAAILSDIESHHKITRDNLLEILFA